MAVTTSQETTDHAAPPTADHGDPPHGSPTATLVAAVFGFFVITIDALVVNVALPDNRNNLGGGITGLQWVIDGYTLMFAALLLSAGSFGDSVGARRAFGTGWPCSGPRRRPVAWPRT